MAQCRSDRHPVSFVRPDFAARSTTFGSTPPAFSFFDSSAISGTRPMNAEFVVERDLQRCCLFRVSSRVSIPDTLDHPVLVGIAFGVRPSESDNAATNLASIAAKHVSVLYP